MSARDRASVVTDCHDSAVLDPLKFRSDAARYCVVDCASAVAFLKKYTVWRNRVIPDQHVSRKPEAELIARLHTDHTHSPHALLPVQHPRSSLHTQLRLASNACLKKPRLRNHSVWAIGVTAHLDNGGMLGQAVEIAGHTPVCMMQLRDHWREGLDLNER
jgi:hypothetical protein